VVLVEASAGVVAVGESVGVGAGPAPTAGKVAAVSSLSRFVGSSLGVATLGSGAWGVAASAAGDRSLVTFAVTAGAATGGAVEGGVREGCGEAVAGRGAVAERAAVFLVVNRDSTEDILPVGFDSAGTVKQWFRYIGGATPYLRRPYRTS
jgi:hypothetical protein